MTKLTMYCLIARRMIEINVSVLRSTVPTFALLLGQSLPACFDCFLQNLQCEVFRFLTFGKLQNAVHFGPRIGMISKHIEYFARLSLLVENERLLNETSELREITYSITLSSIHRVDHGIENVDVKRRLTVEIQQGLSLFE
jgi:hypothetical protein